MTWFRFVLIVLVIVVLAGGCATPRVGGPAAAAAGVFRPATAADVSATEYRVAPPDKLALRAPDMKELDGLVTQIRPDGKISVNLLGETSVAGKTPAEIGRLLSAAAVRYYEHVDIRVEVMEYNSKFYEVFGPVIRDPGRRAYTGRNTVISALCDAGFNEDAWPQQVSLSRHTRDGGHATAIIDMKPLCQRGDMTQNYLIEEGDVLFVPSGPLVPFEKAARQTFITVISACFPTVQPAEATHR